MKRVAIYGKGGIGKSTIAANLSAAMARRGVQVLQIGCDPKHDSTRLLMHGRQTTTVLDYLRRTKPEERNLTDVVYTGYQGVLCVEAGGPEPGVGCAGRGILSTFELLEQLGIERLAYDIVLYDVLGDVVCGGFAVPLRHRYANAIYIVTSGEFMSVYAANNILRGVRNYDGEKPRMGGILFNQRGIADEEGRVKRFAEAVHLPISATFPRSELFFQAEKISRTLIEAFPDSDLARSFVSLSNDLMQVPTDLSAHPLSDQDLEKTLLGTPLFVVEQKVPETPQVAKERTPIGSIDRFSPRFLSKTVRHREPLGGCAFSGAVHTTAQVLDAVTLAHGPRSCSHISQHALVSTARRTLHKYGVAVPSQLAPPLVSSDMDERVIIYGSTDELEATIREIARSQPAAIFVVTTCPAGIIGDDIQGVIARLTDVLPEVQIKPVLVDGNTTGDYTQGIINACLDAAASLIDPNIAAADDLVNIVGEKNLATNAEPNYMTVEKLLLALGLRVNCRFVRQTRTSELRCFMRARLNLLAYDETMGRVLRDYMSEHFGAVFATRPFPVGFYETERWLQEIATFFHRQDRVEPILAQHRGEYRALVEQYRPGLTGKRMFIVTYNPRLDWLLETAADMGVQVVKLAVLEYAQDDQFSSRYDVPIETRYALAKIRDDILDLRPDIVLSNFALRDLPDGIRTGRIPICPEVGFQGGLVLADQWHRLLKAPVIEGWRRDESLCTD